jgi:hypothetical protein
MAVEPTVVRPEINDIRYCLWKELPDDERQWYTIENPKKSCEAIVTFRSKDNAIAFREAAKLETGWKPCRLKNDRLLEWLRLLMKMGITYIVMDAPENCSPEDGMDVYPILDFLVAAEN